MIGEPEVIWNFVSCLLGDLGLLAVQSLEGEAQGNIAHFRRRLGRTT
jgi:hypothetical protein